MEYSGHNISETHSTMSTNSFDSGETKTCRVCPVCTVRIIEDAEKEPENPVLFSHGKPGTKARLWARVCSYIQDRADKYPHCINKDFIHSNNPDHAFIPTDFFSSH